MSTDFESEGLLEGTSGEVREDRLALLRELEADGVPLGELRRAVAVKLFRCRRQDAP